ncbi:rhodanese-like domain-containing protein [Mycoplasmatota bacterium zrk1]
MKYKIIIVFLMVFALLTGCDSSNAIENITVKELSDVLNEDYQFVDVRTKEEYDFNHIEEFGLNLDYYVFSSDNSLLDGLDKDKPVVLICRSGNRSSEAAKILKKEGFSSIYNVLGGMNDWNKE